MKNILITGLISLTAFQCQSPKQTDREELPLKVVETIEKRIINGVTPGMAIALIDSSGTRYFNFGKTEKNGKVVDENTIYEIGSITKVFTGIMLAKQVLDGDVKMDDGVNGLLPDSIDIPVMGDDEITLGDLSDHTSGLPKMPLNFKPANPQNPYADYSVRQMYEFIENYQPTREVGSEYAYSNLAMGLLGHVLANNKNTTYEKMLIQTIADPLGMDDTRIELTERMKENLALGHRDEKVVENWDIPTLAGAGAIRSSAYDMAKFISANLGYENTPLTEPMKLSQKIRHDKAGDMSVGKAWHIKTGKDGDIIWHNGGTGGYKAFAGLVKETGKGVVILTNSAKSVDDIGFKLLDPGSELADIKFSSDAVELSESTLSKYVGVYELHPAFKITILKEDKQLFSRGTGEERLKIYPENDTTFYFTGVDAKISFQLKQGLVESLVLIQNGKEMVGKKVK